MLCDVVLQQARRHHSGPGAGVAIKQRPVVAGDALGLLGREGRQERNEDLNSGPCTIQQDVYLCLKITESNTVKTQRRALNLVTAITNTLGMKRSQPPYLGQEV